VLDPARLAIFVAATLALLVTPGPAVLFIVTRSMAEGRRAGLLSVLGIELGNSVHCLAATLGLAAILASSPVAFAVVKYLGAAYLVVLGLRKLLDAGAPGLAAAAPARRDPPREVLRQAILVAVLNPKTALFFLAFLPQFADPTRGPLATQMLLLGATFVGLALVTDSGYALVAGTLGAALRRHPQVARAERWVSSAVFIGLGALAALAAAPTLHGGR